MKKEKILYLNPIDIFILTLIFFGEAIISSAQGYFLLQHVDISKYNPLEFNDISNWRGIALEIFSLFLAWLYLYFRKFDFSQLDFSINKKTPIKIFCFILLASIIASTFELAQYYFFELAQWEEHVVEENIQEEISIADQLLGHFSLSYFLYSLLNGFFEEIFFVGLIFCVSKKHLPYAIIFSLIIRFSFHTYQGIPSALIITTLGITFFLLRLRYKELVPFFLAHSFFDLFGMTFLLGLFYLI